MLGRKAWKVAFQAFLLSFLLVGHFALTTIPPGSDITVSPPVSGRVEAPPLPAPVIVGWGGVRLDENDIGLHMDKLQSLGLNGIRISFESQCGSNTREMGPYDPTNLQAAIDLARAHDMWIIIDYHGYTDLSSDQSCWLSFWQGVVTQFKNSYDKIIWEPLNEPTSIDVPALSAAYQSWIDQARSLGDTHWIVVQNLCSYGCGLSNFADGFPSVNDSAGKVFISLHTYMSYSEFSGSWDNTTAETVAQNYYQAMLEGRTRTGWPLLSTEGGADELSDGRAPDEVLTGSAGYTAVTLHMIQTLTNLLDNDSTGRINWVWWTIGSWTNTPGAGLYGSLASDGWGSLLQYQKVGQVSTLSVSFSSQPSSPTTGQTITFTATSSGGLPPYSYNWDFGDGATASGQVVNHAYSLSGDYAVKATVTDAHSDNSIAQSVVSIGGGGANNPPVISVPGLQTVDELTPLVFTVSATDSDIPAQTLTLAASQIPSGSTFDPADGRFSWTASESQGPGDYAAIFNANDGNGGSITANVAIHVSEVNSPPSIIPQGSKTVAQGDTLAFTVEAVDADIPANNVILTASGLASGMAFEPATRRFSFSPKASQVGENFTITFKATDDGTPGLSDTRDQVVSVESGAGNGTNCVLCVSSTYTWLLGVGIIFGVVASFAALSLSKRKK